MTKQEIKQDIERESFQFGKRAGSPLEVLIDEKLGTGDVDRVMVQRYDHGIGYQEFKHEGPYTKYTNNLLFYWDKLSDGTSALFLDYDTPQARTGSVGSTAGFFSIRTELVPDKGTKIMGFYLSMPGKPAIQEVNSHIAKVYANAEQNRKAQIKGIIETNTNGNAGGIDNDWKKRMLDEYNSRDYSSPPQIAEDLFVVLREICLQKATAPSDSEARRE